MKDRIQDIMDVAGGNRELQIGLDMQDLARVFAAVFLAMLLAGLLVRVILPNR